MRKGIAIAAAASAVGGVAAGAAAASANTAAATSSAYAAGVAIGSANTAAATGAAYSAGVATGAASAAPVTAPAGATPASDTVVAGMNYAALPGRVDDDRQGRGHLQPERKHLVQADVRRQRRLLRGRSHALIDGTEARP